MKPIRKSNLSSFEIKGGNIPVKPKFAETFQQFDFSDWLFLFHSFRLDLQGRIISLSGDDVIKLQGKLEYVEELEKFFEKLVSGKS